MIFNQNRKSPVFIVGSPRSGTTFLYHLLVSTGNFVKYMTESHVYNLFSPLYGPFDKIENRRKFLEHWINSEYFKRTGLDKIYFHQAEQYFRNPGEFLQLIMGKMANMQGKNQWAECTPINILFVDKIKKEIPDAKFIHIVRDGRAVASSLAKKQWIEPLPWHNNRLLAAACYWSWLLSYQKKARSIYYKDWIDIKYEDIVMKPRESIKKIGIFIGSRLDYEMVEKNPIGTCVMPNSSFGDYSHGYFDPINRWKKILSLENIDDLTYVLKNKLEFFDYSTKNVSRLSALKKIILKQFYLSYCCLFTVKHNLKNKSRLGKIFTDDITMKDIKAFEG